MGHEFALKHYSGLIEEWPSQALFPLVRGELFLKGKNFYRAIEDATRAIFLRPTYYDAFRFRAKVRMVLGRDREALDDLSQSIKLCGGPEYVACLCMRARVLLRLDQRYEALIDVDKALGVLDRDGEALRLRGRIRMNMWDLKGAAMDFSLAIHTGPARAEDYYNRGKVHELRGAVLQAVDDYKKALEMAPGWGAVGRAYYEMRERVLRKLGVAS